MPLYFMKICVKIMQTSGMETCFRIPECRFILCKDNANERKPSLFVVSRVPLYLMQRYVYLPIKANGFAGVVE